MKLLELVKYFRDGHSFEEFCQTYSLDLQSEVIEIYMEQPLKIDNELAFFEIEKTEGNIEYEYEYKNIKYSNLFDFYYFLDAIEESKNAKNHSLSNEQLTKLLFNYAINDA
ncbi:hypothetical protein LF887_06985 [Chryseobacterium sp. MEBOG06]|uniref:hypothetical protein n=1 Tax=Chryseobacterium sp. MEBOG06 TaxID=2879938 RepID=UPI001F301153|nr:hypothetical protein [Chryseobacterium sp. MEBOG06]UKB85364.1 hypothetical protein LF887_06985 [Chryseobacterium sp. MEBOG06]